MNPLFFGDSGEQLFGAYHSAVASSRRGAVICYPWAREYLLAHPTLRLLAQRLADNAIHTLRFDYYGTGDSAGDANAAGSERWIRDIGIAIEELRDVANIQEVTLIGMRLGGALASLAAATRPEVTRLVLWDPVLDGDTYLDELGAPASNGDAIDVLGSVLTPSLRSDLGAIKPELVTQSWRQTLVIQTLADASVAAVTDSAQKRGLGVERDEVNDVTAWREEWGRGGKGLAVNAVNRIVAWLR